MSIAGKATQTSAIGEDLRDGIRVVGAREHNLKDLSLIIPKNRITVFVGVSGSGKSSIVFDSIAVEAQRQLYATFPPSSGISCPTPRSSTASGWWRC